MPWLARQKARRASMTTTNSREPRCCEFCGAEIEYTEVPSPFMHRDKKGKLVRGAYMLPKACTCEGAQAAIRAAEAEEAARKAAEEKRAREAAYQRAGIPRRYWDAELDPEDECLLEKVKAGQGLFLTGKCGRGKTYAACAILRRLIAEGWRRVRFSDVEGIEREVTTAWGNRGESEQAVIDRYVNAEVVVIDDLGAEEMTAVTMKTLRAVISGREANGGVTIFTSNYSRKEFALHIAAEADKVMASRLASRIAGMTEVKEFEGVDRRIARG